MNKVDKQFLQRLKESPLASNEASHEEMMIWLDLNGFTSKDISKMFKILSAVHNLNDDVITTAPSPFSTIAKRHGMNVIFNWRYASTDIFRNLYALMEDGLLDKDIANDDFKNFIVGMKSKYAKLGNDQRTLDMFEAFAEFEDLVRQRIAHSYEVHRDECI